MRVEIQELGLGCPVSGGPIYLLSGCRCSCRHLKAWVGPGDPLPIWCIPLAVGRRPHFFAMWASPLAAWVAQCSRRGELGSTSWNRRSVKEHMDRFESHTYLVDCSSSSSSISNTSFYPLSFFLAEPLFVWRPSLLPYGSEINPSKSESAGSSHISLNNNWFLRDIWPNLANRH